MRKKLLRIRGPAAAFGAFVGLAGSIGSATAQIDTSPVDGLHENTPGLIALRHARLVVKPGQVVEDGTLVMRDGVIVSAGSGAAPEGALEIDLSGKTVFAGFIDAQTDYAQVAEPTPPAPQPQVAAPFTPTPQQGARHWNSKVRPERDVAQLIKPDAKKAESLRKLGFTTALSAPDKGVFRGQSALVTLAESTRANDVLIKPQIAQHLAFELSRFPSSEYPDSLIGAVALVRQTFYDTRWQHDRLAWQAKQRGAERIEANLALDALEAPLAGRQPIVFSTEDELDFARVFALANEFKLKLIIGGNGYEYREVARIKNAGVPVIVPLTYPEAPAVEDPDRALDVGLSELEHWEWAPFNARVLAEAGVPFAITSAGLKKPEDQFWTNLRKAVASGLDENLALAALTVQPATMLGAADRLGTLEAGKLAQIIVADADLFRSDKARIYETWIDGKRYALASIDTPDPRGVWNLRWSGVSGPASIEISGELPDLTAKAGDKSFPAIVGDRRLTLYPPGELLGVKRERVATVLSLTAAGVEGRGQVDASREFRVDGTLANAKPRVAEAAKAKPALPSRERRYPFGEYGRTALPASQSVIVRNATIWTQGPQGKLEDADIAVANGKIVAVGKGVKAPAGAIEIDGRGKHVAPGIIDTHSHTAVAKGVNEGSHAVTAEVRIGDALDPTDMSIYRLLAGGTTTAQLLHGSANPIGGQSQIIKLRWGSDADGLRFEGAPPTIKFALGENVKQSNWGDLFTKRYPQTRMGVEQIDLDTFLAAQAYGEAVAKQGKSGEPVRRDLRLETIWEILQKKRFVHIHSYRQDEILAFIRLSERFGIVPVFQHILEGYKVADAMAKIGAGGSGFTDWWAYKMEVADAIPYNGALMAKQGVVASFNSDSDELARRLNTEAAKAIKYGGLSETDAFNFVTLNSAKNLRVDNRIGSLEVGKDADFAIWTGSPLSSLSMPEQTWIEGRKYFDRSEDLAERARIDAERERLVGKILPERVKALAKKDGKDKKDDKADGAKPQFAHWDGELSQADLVRYATLRGPYHDDEPVNTCSAQEAH